MLKSQKLGPIQASPTALVGVGRITETIADHPLPPCQGGFDQTGQMFPARREHQQRLGFQMHGLIEQQFAQFLAELSPAGLACDMNDMPALAQGFRHPLDMTALSCTVDSLESDEFAFHFPPL